MPKQHGKLKDIKIHEVSMVDLPANKLPFLFFKNEDGQPIETFNKKKKMKIEIESDGTAKGTKISIDGKSLGEIRDFSFYFYGSDAQSPVSCNYSKVVEAEDGFKRTETFYLSKGEIMDKKTLELLKAYFGEEDVDVEKKIDEKEIQKALALITKEYKDDLPEDLEKAVGVLAINACCSEVKVSDEDVKKAGAKFSKDVIAKLKAIITAVEALKGLLPEVGKESKEKSDNSDEVAELTKRIAELTESLAKGKNDELTETLESLKKKIEVLEKGGVEKTSIEEQETENDDGKSKGAGKDGKVLWASIINQS